MRKLYYCERDRKLLSSKEVEVHKCLLKKPKRKRFIARDGKPHFKVVGEKCWRLVVGVTDKRLIGGSLHRKNQELIVGLHPAVQRSDLLGKGLVSLEK